MRRVIDESMRCSRSVEVESDERSVVGQALNWRSGAARVVDRGEDAVPQELAVSRAGSIQVLPSADDYLGRPYPGSSRPQGFGRRQPCGTQCGQQAGQRSDGEG